MPPHNTNDLNIDDLWTYHLQTDEAIEARAATNTITGTDYQDNAADTTTYGDTLTAYPVDGDGGVIYRYDAPQYTAPQFNIPTFITTEDLDKFARKIYKIITEHTHIDITEDEYMAILKEE